MPDISAADVYAYIACSVCSRRVDAEIGATSCCVHYVAKQTKAIVRANLKAFVTDGTGSVKVTAFGTEVEQILALSPEEIYSFKLNQGDDAFDRKLIPIKKEEMIMLISPTYDLSLSNALKWVVRTVEPPQDKCDQLTSLWFQLKHQLSLLFYLDLLLSKMPLIHVASNVSIGTEIASHSSENLLPLHSDQRDSTGTCMLSKALNEFASKGCSSKAQLENPTTPPEYVGLQLPAALPEDVGSPSDGDYVDYQSE